MDPTQRELFQQALERKQAEAAWRARMIRGGGPPPKVLANNHLDPQAELRLIAHERPQDVPNPRAKSARHGKLTADKWNQ
jgi:hypothetical protein